TITGRRRLVNSTGAPISRVRLRVVDVTTFPAAVGIADLRLVDSTNLVTETPPAEPNGGGVNVSTSPTAVTLATPLANGANTPVGLVFGGQQTGCFHFIVTVETLPGGADTVFGFAGQEGAGGRW